MKLAARARLARLDRPIGTLLTAFPAFWGLTLASSPGWPSLGLAAVLGTGALFARSAGCVVNDMWDKKFDGQVERTKLRPLASKELSTQEAVSTLAVFSTGAALCLLPLNHVAQAICCGAVVPIALYPSFKRWTYFPQVFLGITFNLGALVGFAAVHGQVTASAVLLYAGSVAWTASYDTVYAHQDKRDDAALSLKSTALWDKKNFLPFSCATAAAILWSASLGLHYNSLIASALAVPAGLYAIHLSRVDVSNPQLCGVSFKRNMWVGPLLLFGIAACSWGDLATKSISTWMLA